MPTENELTREQVADKLEAWLSPGSDGTEQLTHGEVRIAISALRSLTPAPVDAAVEEIERLYQKATPGLWDIVQCPYGGAWIVAPARELLSFHFGLITALVNAWPALYRQLRAKPEARGVAEAVREACATACDNWPVFNGNTVADKCKASIRALDLTRAHSPRPTG